MTNDLFKFSESRGKEAAGVILLSADTIYCYKEPIRPSIFIKKADYKRLFKIISLMKKSDHFAIIGHARLATNGFQTKNKNNQPVVTGNTIGVHNGIIVNDSDLWKKMKKKTSLELDTQAVFELLNVYIRKGYQLKDAVRKVYAEIEGSASLAVLSRYARSVVLATNTGSLYLLLSQDPSVIVFASEDYIISQWAEKYQRFLKKPEKRQLSGGSGLIISLADFSREFFPLSGKTDKTKKQLPDKPVFKFKNYSDNKAQADKSTIQLYQQLNNTSKLKKHDFDYKKIYSLRRCSKCILPETTPFIHFDQNGVCNYCREHKKIKYLGRKALEKVIQPFRSENGKPDCIIAFSGGRDSSYSLHLLKKEFGLNPIAYTYDWGMVTDLARQNEARMVGKLGIEHIIVSADITQKRQHIKNHILAWMKKPDLGMVPLFMEGDKQCEFYVDQLAKKNNIKLIFFCRGNEYEKEEFKTGHCGIKNADPGGVIHNLPLSGKIRLALYYGRQYLINPAYINSSIFDTLFAYFSTYIQKHDYIFLWHYLPWDEQKIVSTLKEKYNWQTSQETPQTWRTDDGSSAFYNYIYYTGQGFTENDSFRARQIREGKLTREQAIKIVNEENKPRYEALKWYFDRVGLDGDKVLRVVDKMKKKY